MIRFSDQRTHILIRLDHHAFLSLVQEGMICLEIFKSIKEKGLKIVVLCHIIFTAQFLIKDLFKFFSRFSLLSSSSHFLFKVPSQIFLEVFSSQFLFAFPLQTPFSNFSPDFLFTVHLPRCSSRFLLKLFFRFFSSQFVFEIPSKFLFFKYLSRFFIQLLHNYFSNFSFFFPLSPISRLLWYDNHFLLLKP